MQYDTKRKKYSTERKCMLTYISIITRAHLQRSLIKMYYNILKFCAANASYNKYITQTYLKQTHFHFYINPIYLKRGPICPQDIFYSISLVFRSPVSFPVEYSMQIIHRLQRKQKCKILACQTFLITIL